MTNHFLQVGPQKYSIYREEAVDAITVALNLSLIDENVKARCCKALSLLGGCFSLFEKLTGNWILNPGAELNVNCKENFKSSKGHRLFQDDGALLVWLLSIFSLHLSLSFKPFTSSFRIIIHSSLKP